MREILFRGKEIDTGKWLYGSLCHYLDDNSYYINFTDDNGDDIGCMVDSETVGQYTGLCDKNGTKIFEGDIVQFEDGEIAYIEYEDSAFIFANSPVCPCYLGESSGEGLEVIGNIFDNP